MMGSGNDKVRILLKRALVMLAVMTLFMSIIVVRLIYLQIVESDKYKTLSDKNRIALRILPPRRGNIYDRNGKILASNQQRFRAAIVAEQSPDVHDTLYKLSKIIELDDADIAAIKADIKRNRKFVPIKVKEDLSWEKVVSLQLHAPELPGVVVDEGFTRFYENRGDFAHVLGYVGAVDSNKDSKDPLLFVPDFKIGKSGIEKTFEDRLRGEGGNIKMEVNALGRVMKHIEREEPKNGQNLYLSLDSRLQRKAYELFGDESGALVLMNVKTGEILAYVSTPSFDPNMFIDGMDYKTWQSLVKNPKKPLSDKVISGVYSPGSTFKMITALAGLESGAINLNTKVNCKGAFELGGHIFHCWKHSGHGDLNVVEALEHSCDVFFYEQVLKIGIDNVAKTAKEFGLGELSGLGLLSERTGTIPNKKWKMSHFKQKWQQGESVIASIGQGYVAVTPLQLAVMVSRIANGKEKVMPTLLKQEGKPEFEKLSVAARNIAIVKSGMYDVVNSPSGTAHRAAFNINGAEMAGKTGTTQVRSISLKERKAGVRRDSDLPWELRNHALFVGFAPYDDPLYAVSVIVEHGSSGSGVAAPIASKILQEAIKINAAR